MSEPADALTRQFARSWPLLLGLGLLGVIAGIIVIIDPGSSLVTLAWIAGIFLVVDGVFALAGAVTSAESRGVLAVVGILGVIAGLYLMRHPIAGVVAIALVLGIWLVAHGLVRITDALGRGAGDRTWTIIGGVVEVVAGVIIVASPGIGITTLALLVGLAFLLRGIGEISAAWVLRSAARS